MTDEEHDLVVSDVTSFYQSKRAHLKKQVTHWYGKFMICKAENNMLRKNYKHLCAAVRYHREQEASIGILLGKLETKINGLESHVQELEAGALV